MKAIIPASPKRIPQSKRVTIRSHIRRKEPGRQLPFVGDDHGPWSQWDLPVVAGFGPSVRAGSHIADIYLKHMRAYGGTQQHGAQQLLSLMILSMIKKEANTEEERHALSGQVIGFAQVISGWLYTAVRECGYNLDKIEASELLLRANYYIGMTDDEFIEFSSASQTKAEE